ncbi:hypothetical protein DVB69_14725 [Sporosarcina sp. BI001-red]|nr:hypothetical protein DVB69_14725 [Sporosarcina sp. BI001-red]
MFLVLAIPLFAKANTLEERRLAKQRERLSSLQPPAGNPESTITRVSIDALTRITIHEETRQIFCWRAIEDSRKPVAQPRANMTYTLDNFGFSELEAVAMVENSEVINMSYASTNIPLLEYIKQEIMSKLPKDIKSNKVHTLALVMQFRDVGNPFYQVNFIKDKHMDVATNSPEYAELFNVLELLNTNLTNIINNQPFQDAEKSTIKKPNTVPKVDINSIRRPQDNGAKVLGKMDTSYQSNDQQVMGPSIPSSTDEIVREAIPPSHTENPIPVTEETEDKPKELSYFEKLVLENKRQLDSKGPAEKK